MLAPSVQPFAVQATPELRRVLGLPRRIWAEGDAEALARDLTAVLRTPNGRMTLRPRQAVALYEAAAFGAFVSERVGGGKTLISLLLPYVLDARRPLLLIPAKLIGKTQREQAHLMQHWRIPNFIRIVSYELLGRPQSEELLEQYKPDLFVCDEAHRLKNFKGAAVTKRVMRYLHKDLRAQIVPMSGSFTNQSINDCAHLLKRSIRQAPLPRTSTEVQEWADALDVRADGETRLGTGALVLFCNQEEAALHAVDPLTACRRAYRRRLFETPGVLGSTEPYTGSSLSISALPVRMGPETEAAMHKLRTTWELPHGEPLISGLAVWRHLRELALGFCYRWDPPAPPAWLAARKEWSSWCRYILTTNRRELDSEVPVIQAVDRGQYPAAEPALAAWRAIRGSFKPRSVPVWLGNSALLAAERWAWHNVGIIWTEHVAFAEALAQLTGLEYYGKEGLNRHGVPIEHADPGKALIASIESNHEGRNLQAWSKNLITSPPPNGRRWEQILGRTHRDEQKAEEVTVDVFLTCPEHLDAWRKARMQARYTQDTKGQPQKILYADLDETLAGDEFS